MTTRPGDYALGYLEKHHKICKADSGAIKFRVSVPRNSALLYLLTKECPHKALYEIKLCQNGTLSNMNTDNEIVNFSIPDFFQQEYHDMWLTWFNDMICMGLLDQPPFLKFKERNKRNKQLIGFIKFITIFENENTVEWDIFSPSDTKIHRPMQSLKEIDGGKLRWVDMEKGGSLPLDAVIGGFEGEPLYIARAPHRGSLTPGKYLKSQDCAYLPWGHEEIVKTKFQILCGFDAVWQKCVSDQIPENAFIAGKSEVRSEPLYIGRVWVQSNLIPGKVHTLNKNCCIPYKGKELATTVYEILVTAYRPPLGHSFDLLCYTKMKMQPCI